MKWIHLGEERKFVSISKKTFFFHLYGMKLLFVSKRTVSLYGGRQHYSCKLSLVLPTNTHQHNSHSMQLR